MHDKYNKYTEARALLNGVSICCTRLLFYSPPTAKIKSVQIHHRRVWLLECRADPGSSVETVYHVIQAKQTRRLLVPIPKSVRNSIQCSLLQQFENWGMSYGIQVFFAFLYDIETRMNTVFLSTFIDFEWRKGEVTFLHIQQCA